MRVLYTAIAVFICSSLIGQIDPVPATDQVRVFVLAGQSNMQGQGKIYDGSNGAIGVTITSFIPSCGELGTEFCDFTFNMLDGYGDGWNGWTYDFVQDGVVVATETLPNGSEGTATITLEDGVACDVVVNNAGPYGAEISWTLTDPFGDVVASLTGQEENYPSPNTLLDVVANDGDGLWSMLQTEGEWTVLDNAFLYFENGQGTIIHDHATIGQGANPNLIGPELMFAHQMDAHFEDPVLIIKTAWGGLSLAEDFRPPSAGGTTGPYYTEMIEMVAYVTENLETEFPEIGLTDFELSGFAWFQGWNDGGSDDFLNEYESNLYHLVDDIRNEFQNPELPVVIASSGQGGYEETWGWMQNIQEIVAVAQENVACNDELYGGTVGFVDTKPFYMDVLESPDDAGYHYHNNALSFLNIGKSIGDEMILAINDQAYCSAVTSVLTENGNASAISIYPNPVSNVLMVDLGGRNGDSTIIRLYDSNGKIVFDNFPQSAPVVDVSTLAAGLYLLEIIADGHVDRRQVVVE